MRFCGIKRDKEAYFEITDAFCMVSFSKLLVCTTDCRNHSPAPLLPPQGSPGRQWRMRQRIHPGLQSLRTNSKDAAKRRAERRSPCGAGSSSRPGHRAGPASAAPRTRHRQQHPQSETPHTAQGSGSSAVLLVQEKSPNHRELISVPPKPLFTSASTGRTC